MEAREASAVGEELVSRAESRRQSHGDKEGTVLCTTELQGSSGGGRQEIRQEKLPKPVGTAMAEADGHRNFWFD